MSWQRILMLVVAGVFTGLFGLSLLVGGLDQFVGLTTPPVVEVIRPWISMVGSIVGFVFVAYLIFIWLPRAATKTSPAPARPVGSYYRPGRGILIARAIAKYLGTAIGFTLATTFIVVRFLFEPYRNLGRTALVVLWSWAHLAAFTAALFTDPMLGIGLILLVASCEFSLFLYLAREHEKEVQTSDRLQGQVNDLNRFHSSDLSTIESQARRIKELEAMVHSAI